MLEREDFEQWMAARPRDDSFADTATAFANEMMEPYRHLIIDIVTHIDTQVKGRYASTKDENEAVEQLNDRIMELIDVTRQREPTS